ncbi:MAG: glutathione peroxidase [Clostridiales bacterium]|nr:glutathione peroxidase [Clostridiales bacterium]
MGIYDFTVRDARHREVPLSEYRGKVLLIVNTATGCGFTPQYEGLEALYRKYRDQGFEILDFPCNQFFGQAPGTEEEIMAFCQLNYGTTFRTFEKIDVNGEHQSPLYEYLKARPLSDAQDEGMAGLIQKLKGLGHELFGADIKWNFTKFLVNRQGDVVGRFAPTVAPAALDGRIAALLKG